MSKVIAGSCQPYKYKTRGGAADMGQARANGIRARQAEVIEVNMERCRNEGAVGTRDFRENPPTNGIVRHDSNLRKSGDPAGDWTRFGLLGTTSCLGCTVPATLSNCSPYFRVSPHKSGPGYKQKGRLSEATEWSKNAKGCMIGKFLNNLSKLILKAFNQARPTSTTTVFTSGHFICMDNAIFVNRTHAKTGGQFAIARHVKAVHDELSNFEINLRKKSLLLPAYILTGALSDMRLVKLKTRSERSDQWKVSLRLRVSSSGVWGWQAGQLDKMPDRLLGSHKGEPGSIRGRATPGFSLVGIVPDDGAGRRIFSGISRFPRPCIPVLLHSQLISPS
ncbi:hypothetical protein PR048_009795 [Dryococelus australis]|uniref:Uncharacterized protein n=1 Tax=Dryococelus australis TaxID=614101 RepID=A0ABQ9I1C2_9NEOP|nr:hypothetical protein PR048_009795 [Dryococelus australis]